MSKRKPRRSSSMFAARRTDPAGSKKAARELMDSGRQETHELLAAQMVLTHPGLTANEIGRLIDDVPLNHDQFRKRIKDCVEKHLVQQGPERICTWSKRSSVQTYLPNGMEVCPPSRLPEHIRTELKRLNQEHAAKKGRKNR